MKYDLENDNFDEAISIYKSSKKIESVHNAILSPFNNTDLLILSKSHSPELVDISTQK